MLDLLGVYSDEDFPKGKSLYCLSAGSISELPEKMEVPSSHFGLLLAADASGWEDEEVLEVARRLVDGGLAVLVAWGVDAARVHDLFDQVRDPDAPAESVILTTWHEDESLDEALWYFVGCASPAEAYADTCTSWVAVSVNHAGWAEHMRTRMEGSRALQSAAEAADGECDQSVEAIMDSDEPASPA